MSRQETRQYPSCCTSAYCGGTSEDCATCPNAVVLAEFKDWVARTNAVQVDCIWCPTLYVGTVTA